MTRTSNPMLTLRRLSLRWKLRTMLFTLKLRARMLVFRVQVIESFRPARLAPAMTDQTAALLRVVGRVPTD